MDSLHIELVSDSSDEIYPNNTLTNFRNLLGQPLTLDGDWEVALEHISFSSLYHNVTDGYFRFEPDSRWIHNINRNDPTVYDITIPSGFYPTVESVGFAMNREMELRKERRNHHFRNDGDTEPYVTVAVDDITKHSKLRFAFDFVKEFRLSSDLKNILGFRDHDALKKPFKMFSITPSLESDLPVDIDNLHTVLVYTDIVEYTVVGDVKAPILRCLPFQTLKEKSNLVIKETSRDYTFENLIYHKLSVRLLTSIKIELKKLDGNFFPVKGDHPTRVMLHLRRIKSF